jgi:type II secretory pathway pseudopilin PulG
MELLVVLLIISIMSAVAFRTIDATRDRSLFDQTTKEIDQLVQAIVGNPDLLVDGRRTDFGFFGDFGRLPQDLRELVYNQSSDPRWRGPYLRRSLQDDTVGYLYDGWGNLYGYDVSRGVITSLGNGRYPLTVRIVDSLPFLYNNRISGSIVDIDGNPPGDRASGMQVRLYTGNGRQYYTAVDAGGFYEFPRMPGDTVFIGNHRLAVMLGSGDSLVRWVTVAPRSNPVVDFRTGSRFRNQLVMVGPVSLMTDSSGFRFGVVNEGGTGDTLTSLRLVQSPDSAYLTLLSISSSLGFSHSESLPQGLAPGVDKSFPSFVVGPSRSDLATFALTFYKDSLAAAGRSRVQGSNFRIRFSDGSEIAFRTPDVP